MMTPEPLIRILTIGDGWLAAEKPAGVSIHNAPGKDLKSLLAARISADADLRGRIDVDADYGFNAVGRLDKEADGLVLAAWRPDVFAALSTQYAARQTGKSYFLLLYGRLAPEVPQSGHIQWPWPLSTQAGGRRNPAGKPPRVHCQTSIDVLETTRHFTLVRCRPQTGRKHQIRRHAAMAGHPVAGDRRYGSAEAADRLMRLYGFDRIALHATALTFTPPGSDTAITIETGGIPASFIALLQGGENP
ncbi:MAG: RNA pseudouridine synthase [Pseudomonadota bacterium]